MSLEGAVVRVLALVAVVVACSGPAPPTATVVAAPDSWPTEGWRRSTPEEQGMDSGRLVELLATVRERELAIDSVLVIRNGTLVLEANVHPFTAGSKHMILSCTKSIVSALVGIAIEQGYLRGTEQKVLDFFPRRVVHPDERKQAMTLEHLLTMTTGFECRDGPKYGVRGIRAMRASEDWVQYVLDLPMVEEPGARFEYCNGASHLLSAILQQATGVTAAEFAERHLFAPLGISGVVWPETADGVSIGYAEIRMLPRDLAKIGLLYLHRGVWDGAQVVPAAWIETSTRQHVAESATDGYGYQWWVDKATVWARLGWAEFTPTFTARGWGGQYVSVVPEKNLVVVFTGRLPAGDFGAPAKLLQSKIVPAAISSEPLPPNAEGQELLLSHVAALEAPDLEPRPVPPLPERARQISGETYRIGNSGLGFQAVSLEFEQEDEALLRFTIYDRPWHCVAGLDGVFRITETERPLDIACRGSWTGEDTFVVDWQRIGDAQSYELTFTFEWNEVTIVNRGSSSGLLERINGRIL